MQLIYRSLFFVVILTGITVFLQSCKSNPLTETKSTSSGGAAPAAAAAGGSSSGGGGSGNCSGFGTTIESFSASTSTVSTLDMSYGFTSDVSGKLTRVAARIWNNNLSSPTLLLTIRPKSGSSNGYPYGTSTILNGGIAQSVTIPATDPGAGGVVVDLDYPVTVAKGSQYWITFQRITAGSFNVRYRNANIDWSMAIYWSDLTGYSDWEGEFAAYGCVF